MLLGQDTVEHIIFVCPRWKEQRKTAEHSLSSPVTPENLIDIMLRDDYSWDVVARMLKDIMATKEADERFRENHPGAPQMIIID